MTGSRKVQPPGEPQSAPFYPYATMFKLSEPDSLTVECVACRALFPLDDILSGELEEHECPKCLTTAGMYWADKIHREVEPDDGDDSFQENE